MYSSTKEIRQSTSVPIASFPSAAPADHVFALVGQVWMVSYAGHSHFLSDSVGSKYLDYLLRKPFKSIHVNDFITQVHGEAVECNPNILCESPDELVLAEERPDVILSGKSRPELEKWVVETKPRCRKLRADGRLEDAQNLEEEIADAEKHLKQQGFGKRAAKFCTRTDRNRKSVTAAIRRSIKVIGILNASLGRHLSNSIHTGAFCTYQPEQSLNWSFEMLRPV